METAGTRAMRVATGLVLTAAMVVSIGCHRASQQEKLAALDEAFKSGVLTTQEYQAKRSALLGESVTTVATTTPPAQPAGTPHGSVATPSDSSNPQAAFMTAPS